MDPRFTQKQQARQAEALHNKQIRQALASGQLQVLDRIGQPIEKGALVIWKSPFDLVFEVLEATPMLEPGAPPGAVKLILACTTPMGAPAGQPQMSMIRIGTQASPGHASLDPIQAQEAPVPTNEADVPLPLGEDLPQSD